MDFIVSKDLRKERGSDPELLFTSFRLDLSNFFLNFFYRTLRSYTLSPLISFRLDDPWQSVLPPPSPLEMRSPEEMIKIKNMNQMTFAKIKKMIYLAFQWIPEIIAHTLRLNLEPDHAIMAMTGSENLFEEGKQQIYHVQTEENSFRDCALLTFLFCFVITTRNILYARHKVWSKDLKRECKSMIKM